MYYNFKQIEKNIGYRFRNKRLLLEALTHSSYKYEHTTINYDNERMEYLGDAVLGFILADYLYNKYPELSEGELSIIRSDLSKDETLASIAKDINLGEFILLGKGEFKTGGFERKSNLADCLEAIIGAAWIDNNIKASKKIVYKIYNNLFNTNYRDFNQNNPKGKLQELSQENGYTIPIYKTIKIEGPKHSPQFTILLNALDKKFESTARTKRDAEKQAAQKALDSIHKN